MPRVQAGEIELGWREWGRGEVTVVFIHGNLASKDWIELAAPLFPTGLRVIAIDWRGCGDSDRPKPAADYSNYSMQQHAEDMLAALDRLDIGYCHLATHSTGGIIAARMLLMQPQRFGRVFALDPVTPLGMSFNADQIGLFRAMMASKDLTRTIMATAASSLFVPESMAPNAVPRFRDGLKDIQALFDRIIEQTFGVSEGIWIGTPVNLTKERESRELERRMPELKHPHLVLWGEWDGWILPADLHVMADAMPDCRLVIVPRVGHSMNLEVPALYAGYFGAWFGGLTA
ncbi:non-heme chloroperoxidase [Bradyrhizobium japonicum]|jgi:pimeloyl-ACP methyl ester carboxylesterase|uniref:alpha/beta fold hydrolase n=1 Tax=Bradyrhizobium TaxID=374 RepID=UPI000419D990|nr:MULTISPECIES: alpha/beta hydrolase [Bradyrhizobium]MBR0879174.1 alpha/beta hydrolase [Bradyrhizobium liaoningense]MBR0941873.1 alpha/beta hydrolase [Bradyrhizobium liaoningense]MBR0998506.1 alpha/beta hydrolase [Bradyrhizobium liaoningense]MBR1068809.1 alpha/beta hydrolase [Bradyrhizobium liaoningense]MCP1741573.1 pimeloyl-ACP methyl ester carboxylesterase [Bradyrhizobium japonicum]